MSLDLRPYQVETAKKVLEAFEQFSKVLVQSSTGSGKTVLAAHISKHFIDQGKRVCFMAHREELLAQTLDKFSKSCGIYAELEKAEHRASLQAMCVVASIQTMTARMDRWPEDHFGLIIVDECHRIMGAGYQKVLSRFDSHAKVWGLTATGTRSDRKQLGDYFETVAHQVGLFDLIKQGYLAPIQLLSLPLKIDIRPVAMVNGDYDANGLHDAIGPVLREVVRAIKENAAGRRILVFVPLIPTSKRFVEICLEEGIKAKHIDGTSDDRKEIQEQFQRGDFDLLCNSSLLTEGVDIPVIDCVVMLRPTKSKVLLNQAIGRGTRLCEGKKDLLLLDFLWLVNAENLARPAHLIASTDQEAEEITKASFEKYQAGGQEPLDLEGLATECQIQREQKLRDELAAKAKKKSRFIDAASFFLSVHNPTIAEYEPEMKWESEPVSSKQSEVLERFGFDAEALSCKGQASKVLDLIIDRSKRKLATPKQVKWLTQFRHPSPHTATFVEASMFLDKRFGGKKDKQKEMAI